MMKKLIISLSLVLCFSVVAGGQTPSSSGLLGGDNIDDVEVMPVYQHGDSLAFMKWAYRNVLYPSIAAERGIKGTVVIAFVVNEEGYIEDHFRIMMSPHESLSAEVIRLFGTATHQWTPGVRKDGTLARVEYTLPISFKLN